MSFAYTDVSMKEFQELQKNFPGDAKGKMSLVIPALWLSQRQNGWINGDVVEYVAGLTGTEPLHVWGVATFYSMFNKEPVGKTLLQFCTNISCGLLGGNELIQHACSRLGIEKGGTTQDKKFTIFEVECLGACGTAPVVQVNDTYHENMTMEKLDSLIDQMSS